LSGVATSDAVGTYSSAVAVAFAGTADFTTSSGTGSLTVS
jgi:hypothetical protein